MSRLNDVLARRGMTNEDLYFETRIPISNIRRWRAGTSGPSVENLRTLCMKLGVSADWLIGVVNTSDPAPIAAPWDGVTERRKLASAGQNGD